MKITQIRTIFNDVDIIIGYSIVVDTDNCPNLKLGECKIIQKKWKKQYQYADIVGLSMKVQFVQTVGR